MVGDKTGEDKMRHLPHWETEHWEPGSFEDDVCLSSLPSPSQRLDNIRNPEGAQPPPPSLQLFYLEISRSSAPSPAPTHPASHGPSASHFHF